MSDLRCSPPVDFSRECDGAVNRYDLHRNGEWNGSGTLCLAHAEEYREKGIDAKMNTWGTDDPICPYCGEPQGDFWEVSDDEGEHECGHCERTFSYSRMIEVSYSTQTVPDPNADEAALLRLLSESKTWVPEGELPETLRGAWESCRQNGWVARAYAAPGAVCVQTDTGISARYRYERAQKVAS